jgi:hypothetical protein
MPWSRCSNIQADVRPAPVDDAFINAGSINTTYKQVKNTRSLRIRRQPAGIKRVRQLLLPILIKAVRGTLDNLFLRHSVLRLQGIRKRRQTQSIVVSICLCQERDCKRPVGICLAQFVRRVGIAGFHDCVAENKDLLRLEGEAEGVHGYGVKDDVLEVGLREVLVHAEKGASGDDLVYALKLGPVQSQILVLIQDSLMPFVGLSISASRIASIEFDTVA